MRKLVLITTVSLAALLGACSGTSTVTPAAVAQDIALEASGLTGAFSALKGVVVPPALAAALTDLGTVSTAFAAADTAATKQAVVLRVEADVNAVVSAAATIPMLPPQVSVALQAATVLLPIIEAGVNMAIPAGAAPAAMTADEARLVLVGVGKH